MEILYSIYEEFHDTFCVLRPIWTKFCLNYIFLIDKDPVFNKGF